MRLRPAPRYVYDPMWAARRLAEGLAQGQDAFLARLREVVDLHGIGPVAEHCGLDRQTLYRHIRRGGDPRLSVLASVLAALNLPPEFQSLIPVPPPPVGEAAAEPDRDGA
jgi:DNA-binding phage protein